MSITYEIIEDFGNVIIKATKGDDIYYVPKDPANSDYQRYLRHLAGEDESGTLS